MIDRLYKTAMGMCKLALLLAVLYFVLVML